MLGKKDKSKSFILEKELWTRVSSERNTEVKLNFIFNSDFFHENYFSVKRFFFFAGNPTGLTRGMLFDSFNSNFYLITVRYKNLRNWLVILFYLKSIADKKSRKNPKQIGQIVIKSFFSKSSAKKAIFYEMKVINKNGPRPS